MHLREPSRLENGKIRYILWLHAQGEVVSGEFFFTEKISPGAAKKVEDIKLCPLLAFGY